jgi:hypothetical protein
VLVAAVRENVPMVLAAALELPNTGMSVPEAVLLLWVLLVATSVEEESVLVPLCEAIVSSAKTVA